MEKAIHILQQLLKKYQYKKTDLEATLLKCRSTPIVEYEASSAELLMSRLLNMKVSVANKKLKPNLHENNQFTLKQIQKKYKAWHDKRNNLKEISLYGEKI